MGGRGAGFGGSGKNKVIGLKIAYRVNGSVRFARVSPIKGSKNRLLVRMEGGVMTSASRPKQITQKGGLKAYYNKIKENPRFKTFKVTQASKEREEKESKIWNPHKKRPKWEDL